MFIELNNNNGSLYLRLVESKRSFNKDGKPTCKKIVIYNIGRYDAFDDGKPDYLQRLKDSFKNGNPLIPELKEFLGKKKPVYEHYDLSLSEMDPDCIGHNKLFANALIERIMEEIGINAFVAKYKAREDFSFDVMGFIRLLIYGRILNPASKIATTSQNNNYYSDIIKDIYEYNIYDTLSFLYKYQDKLINCVNNRLISKFKRKTNVIFYDVTNFFFEIEDPDDDDEDGLRKMGVSKENRKQPIVQMGLFMDENGIPISIETFKGNTLDHLTLKEALQKSINNLQLDRFILVGDRGMYRGDNSYYLTSHNNGYIISKSIQKTAQDEKDWIFDKKGYTEVSADFKYKSRVVTRKVKVDDSYETITEKVVVYFSQKFYERQKKENKSFLDFIDKLQKNPENFRISKSTLSSLRRFLKKEVKNEETGEIINSKNINVLIDFDKINSFKESFGYYQIVTSELQMDDKKIIETYHGLSKIEDQFRVMKSDLETRPIFVRTKEHINAHLLICLFSLIIIRIIQNKIINYSKPNIENKWTMGLSAARIQMALNKWTITEITNGYYRFNDIDDKDLKLILDSFGIKIPTKLFRRMELHNLKTSIKIV